MRKLLLTLFLLIFAACNKMTDGGKPKWNDSIIVYSQEEMRKIQRGMIKVIDTACINAQKRAGEDIEKGKMVYFVYVGMTKRYRSNKEMKDLLSKYNIKLDSTSTSCFPPPKGFKDDCYISAMTGEIEKKYGKNFISSIRTQAERKFATRHPNIVFDFEECDTVSRYPGTKNFDEFFKKPCQDFEKAFKYPRGYQYKPGENSSKIAVEFVLTKAGLVKNIKTDVTFNNPENLKYEYYFKSKAEEFVKSVKWIPATKSGVKVDSKMSFWYLHK